MIRIQSFEEMEAWKAIRKLTTEVYTITNLTIFSNGFGLKDLMRQSAVSVSANIAEGLERETSKKFTGFHYISTASCSEFRSHLFTALDLNYINQTPFDDLKDKCSSNSNRLSKFITYLNSSH